MGGLSLDYSITNECILYTILLVLHMIGTCATILYSSEIKEKDFCASLVFYSVGECLRFQTSEMPNSIQQMGLIEAKCPGQKWCQKFNSVTLFYFSCIIGT